MAANFQPAAARSILVGLVVLLAQTALADYQSGLDAYNSGDYNTALSEWKAVAAAPPDTVSPATMAETDYAIGMLYWLGQGVQMDYFEASKWMRKAADLGHAGAEGKMGYLYSQGITVPQNYEVAFEWFSKAAKQGDIDAQYNLGIFYLNGWGAPPDKTMAAQYMAAAAARGDKDAEQALADLLPQLSPSTPEPAQTNQQAAEPQPQTDSAIILPTSWILAQNPDHYTIQVIGLRSIASLENLVRGHEDMAPFACLRTAEKQSATVSAGTRRVPRPGICKRCQRQVSVGHPKAWGCLDTQICKGPGPDSAIFKPNK